MTRAVLRSTDGKAWSDEDGLVWPRHSAATRILIGELENAAAAKPVSLARPIPQDLQNRFPELRQLCLWGLTDLTELPPLPASVVSLDIRDCPRLQKLHSLPPALDDLYLQNCPELAHMPAFTPLPLLKNFAIPGCSAVPQEWIGHVLNSAKTLRRADFSRCSQLTSIEHWPDSLQDIRLNDCSQLSSLPDPWPENLTHLELQQVKMLPRLPDFFDLIDYLDLRRTAGFNTLPDSLQQQLTGNDPPRTLFLYGSRLSVPPASEHGQEEQENVARQTTDYFQHVSRLGSGQANRAKLLILGNGNAGKTCLAMNLTGKAEEYRLRKKQLAADGKSISTHGVQFWNKDSFTAQIGGLSKKVQLQIWDFGGQEIYHNTHRLFISRGSVFVVVWNPDEQAEGSNAATASTPETAAYLDVKRPLSYWLDLIRHACDSDPEIVLVCSRRSQPEAALEAYWKSQLPTGLTQPDRITCLYVDSFNETGQLEQLNQWLNLHVGSLLEREGTAVSADWELAQELAEDLVERATQSQDGDQSKSTLSLKDFHQQLKDWLQKKARRGSKLQQALSDDWQLTEERTQQTLRYLTRIGWVYWDPNLFEQKVIVGQRWALDALYTVLNRDQRIYNVLRDRQGGRFTQSDLNDWGWNTLYTPDQQELLISFMQSCGLCFELYSAEQAWYDRTVYLSFEHLPAASEEQLQQHFDGGLADLNEQKQQLLRPRMHKLDWQRFLTLAGSTYGADAKYCRDGLSFKTKQGQSVLILCDLDQQAGFGGTLKVHVAGPDSADLLQQVTQQLRAVIPDELDVPSMTADRKLGAGVPREQVRPEVASVFLSYAWNSNEQTPFEYEEPVNKIEDLLLKHGCRTGRSQSADAGGPQVLRDKHSMTPGESIVEFMRRGAKATKIILIHSRRYWESPHCLYELCKMRDAVLNSEEKSFAKTVIPVELENSGIREANAKDAYVSYWRSGPDQKWERPAKLNDIKDDQMMTEEYCSTIRYFSHCIDDANSLNLIWSAGGDKVIEHLRLRLGLPSWPLQPLPDNAEDSDE